MGFIDEVHGLELVRRETTRLEKAETLLLLGLRIVANLKQEYFPCHASRSGVGKAGEHHSLLAGLGLETEKGASHVRGDFGIFAESSNRVRVPIDPVGHIDPESMTTLEEDSSQLFINPEQHLKLVTICRNTPTV